MERLVLVPGEGDEERRRQLYVEAAALDPVPAAQFQTIVERRGFDEAWVAEQARRGFIARKEADGQPVIAVTSKARNRYGLPLESAAKI